MLAKAQKQWLYIISALFVAGMGASIAFEQWLYMGVPFAGIAVYVALVRLDWLMWFILFATPLSVTLTTSNQSLGLSLPTEPLLVLVTGIAVIKMFFFSDFDKRIAKHPISIAIYTYLLWMTFTALTSQMPLVSFKLLISRIWFVVPYYFIMAHMFATAKNRIAFLWVFLIPLVIAGLYTLYIHSGHGFSKKTSTWVMWPLFKEHTSYGAVLAMFFPASLYLAFRKSSWGFNAIAWVLLTIMTLALIFSYTRAAWLSLVGAGGIYLIYWLRLNQQQVLLAGLFVLIVGLFNLSLITDKFSRNTTDSSDDFNEHVASVTNVSTDASNLERINRWMCALRMFEERPILGHGPGTYMFLYAPYQKPHEKTIISTNGGNRGNAHSEYLGPLAEAGLLGLLTFLGVVLTTVFISIRVYRHTLDTHPVANALLKVAFTGLITYYLHGFLNNFLDMDKASAPFWGFTALIVALDLAFRPDFSKK